MRIVRFLVTPIVKTAFLVNSISAKIFTFLIVKLLGKEKKVASKKKVSKKI